MTDRKEQVWGFTYDALGRQTQAGFGASSTSPVYDSTITYTYDAASRVTQIVDSANGTITRQYDNRFMSMGVGGITGGLTSLVTNVASQLSQNGCSINWGQVAIATASGTAMGIAMGGLSTPMAASTLGTAGAKVIAATGTPNNWLRITGGSYSYSMGVSTTWSIRWGSNAFYTKNIGNPTLQSLNDQLRSSSIPLPGRPFGDPGHLHMWW